jgi:hypothetical protein
MMDPSLGVSRTRVGRYWEPKNSGNRFDGCADLYMDICGVSERGCGSKSVPSKLNR